MDHVPTYMQDFLEQLDSILQVTTGKPTLKGAGSVSHAQAIEKAEREYRTYQERTLSPVEVAYFEQLKEEAAALKDLNVQKKG